MRKFMGDYLDVGGTSAQGEMLRNAAGISGKLPTAPVCDGKLIYSG